MNKSTAKQGGLIGSKVNKVKDKKLSKVEIKHSSLIYITYHIPIVSV